MRKFLRSVLAVVVGLLLISILTEAVEYGLVSLVNRGGIPTEPAAYFAIRNQGWFLVAKLVYNAAFAFAGGWVAGRIAREDTRHGFVMAALQALGLLYGMFSLEMGQFTPLWVWLALLATMSLAIVLGAQRGAR